MNKLFSSLLLLSISFSISKAQPFVESFSGIPGIGRSAVAFADFDNDLDLDLVTIGMDINAEAFGKIYLNDAGIFVAIESGISGLYNSALALADFDLDGYMDIVMTGQDLNGSATRLYRNSGSGTFELIDAGFYNAGADGDLAWGDYNNDGYPDLVISGGWNTKLYHNNGDGTFAETEHGLTIMNSPALNWGDCDNDGDLDLLMVGDAGSVAEAFVYLNNQGNFTRLEVPVEGAVGGSARWGDFDNDGKLDILITGKDASLVPVSYVYQNNGANSFRFADAGLIGTALGPSDWIDYDNDGDLDIMLSGQNAGCGNASTRLYANNGVGGFDEYPAGLSFAERSSSAWGDFDNDGDYDLLLTGLAGSPVTKLYINELISGTYHQNTVPDVPAGLSTYVSGDYAVVSWSRADDQQSPQMAVSYNVMAGSQTGGIDLVSPQSDILSGKRFTASTGNAGNNDFMIFRSLDPGDYFLRVQSVDQAFTGSGFSEEVSFTVLNTGTQKIDAENVKAFFTGNLLFISGIETAKAEISVSSVSGSLLYNGIINDNHFSLPVSNYPAGVYLINILESGKMHRLKAVK